MIAVGRNRKMARKLSGGLAEKGLAQENLTRAFLTFTQAANSLEQSYSQLQGEVTRLHQELERANAELDCSLEENERVRHYLGKVLERLPCGVIAANPRGEIQMVNPEARRLLGGSEVSSGTNVGKASAEFAELCNGITEHGSKTEIELAVKTNDGDRIIGVLRENLNSSGEDCREAIWILRDLTEQKRIATEKEASRRAQALAEVATVLAHEIRNPLGSMELFTGLLADACAHLPETRQWITHLRAGLRVLSATVNNVLFHARPVLQLLPADLGRLVNEAMDFLQPMARQRGQSIKIENKAGVIAVQADGNCLKQVFLNLSLNAFRAMPPGGCLTVRIGWAPQFPGGAARIDFSDQGRGIDEQLLARVFEPGFTTSHGSPGLGLAVCKQVIAQHHGQIEVQGKPQQGTTFSLILPVSGAVA